MEDHLLLGDVVAVLAECQHRQECGVDRWASIRHYKGRIFPAIDEEWMDIPLQAILERMADNVSVKVVVEQAWGGGTYPAFSLRRIHPQPQQGKCPTNHMHFLYELITHRMIHDGFEYDSEASRFGGVGPPLCNDRYMANLIVGRDHGA